MRWTKAVGASKLLGSWELRLWQFIFVSLSGGPRWISPCKLPNLAYTRHTMVFFKINVNLDLVVLSKLLKAFLVKTVKESFSRETRETSGGITKEGITSMKNSNIFIDFRSCGTSWPASRGQGRDRMYLLNWKKEFLSWHWPAASLLLYLCKHNSLNWGNVLCLNWATRTQLRQEI